MKFIYFIIFLKYYFILNLIYFGGKKIINIFLNKYI